MEIYTELIFLNIKILNAEILFNIEDELEDQMKEISAVNGICLSLEERIKLLITLDHLKSDIKCDEMQFLEKILRAEKE